MILIGRGLDLALDKRLIGKQVRESSNCCAVVKVRRAKARKTLGLIREETSRRELADERETGEGRS